MASVTLTNIHKTTDMKICLHYKDCINLPHFPRLTMLIEAAPNAKAPQPVLAEFSIIGFCKVIIIMLIAWLPRTN